MFQLCAFELETNYVGHDISASTSTNSYESCCSACTEDPRCSTWTWNSSTNTCFLKDSSDGRTFLNSSDYTSGCTGYPHPKCTPIPDRYRCDVDGGQRGVCISDRRQGNYTTANCDGSCAQTDSFSCTSDWDCSLSGECLSGSCQCDSWASGRDCSYLAFQAVDPDRVGYVDATFSSWGGNPLPVIKSASNDDVSSSFVWHLYMAEIACPNANSSRCGLGNWYQHSQVAHATSSSVEGPYTRQGLILGQEHHNPTVKASPVDHTWHMYSISAGGGPIVSSSSSDQGKTWQHTSHGGTQVSKYENPGPFLFPNGTMAMFYRDTSQGLTLPSCSDESIGVQLCAGPNKTCGAGRNPVFGHAGEDPSVFRDTRGNYHMLINALPGSCIPKFQQGGHAWSKDGVTWSEPRVGAYNTTVQFTNGSSMV